VKTAIAQINPTVGDIPGNLQKTLGLIERAEKAGADWILFPELSLVGYPPRDLLDYPRMQRENDEALKVIEKSASRIGVIVGALRANPSPNGKKFFNSAFVFKNQKRIFSYDKRLLPSYDVFEDERYFEKGIDPGIFQVDGKIYGIAICEDVWNRIPFLTRPYLEDPLKDLKGSNLEALFVLSASPFDIQKNTLRNSLLSQIARELSAPVIYCNQVAGNDELIFDGQSRVVAPSGDAVLTLAAFEENFEIWDSGQIIASQRETFCTDESLFRALSFGIKDYSRKSHQKKICLGLSGGIDSSVAAVLAAEALGKENILGVSLPSRFTASASREDAKALAEKLGIEFQELEIEPIYSIFEKVLSPLKPQGLTLENIQPRIRMTLLMAIANQRKMILLNTSNKSEMATGYSTLYGDSAGALAPLGDLVKNQIWSLAHWMNRHSEIIPQRVISRPPSAELRPNQKDEDSLPPYAILDPLVEAIIEKNQESKELSPDLFPGPWVDHFNQLHAFSEFKRKQMPPILRVTGKAFGMGRRIPLACRHYADK